jgi:hypothetical protein
VAGELIVLPRVRCPSARHLSYIPLLYEGLLVTSTYQEKLPVTLRLAGAEKSSSGPRLVLRAFALALLLSM